MKTHLILRLALLGPEAWFVIQLRMTTCACMELALGS